LCVKSKFGTKVHIEKENKDSVVNNKVSNEDTTDDETDDEGAGISAPASSQMSAAVSIHLQNADCTTKTVVKNNRIILSSLSIRANQKSDRCVIVEVGNAYFKITRIPLEFCLSRLTSKQKKELEGEGSRIGANITTTFDNDTITYLVAPDKSTTAKSISAWALNVPTVTVDFISALVARTNSEDPLPNPGDYESPPAELNIENDAVPAKRKCILGAYKVLSLVVSEGEMLCRCTGANIVPLYTEEGSAKSDMKIWQNDEFWADLETKQKEDGMVVVWLDSASKRKKKEKDYLVKKMKEQVQNGGFSISCINQNGCAHAISSGEYLSDVAGNELVPLNVPDVVQTPGSETGKPTESQMSSKTNEVARDELSGNSSQKSSAPAVSEDHPMEDEVVEPGDDDVPAGVEPVTESEIDQSSSKEGRKARKEKQTNQETQSTWIQSSKSSKQISQESQIESQKSAWMSSSRRQRKEDEHEATGTNDVEIQGDEIEEIVEDGNTSGKRKTKLRQTNDGWLCAAPQGKKRREFKRSRAELSAMGEVEFSDPAVTDVCSGLIVRSEEDIEKMKKAQEAQSRSTTNGNVKNFKKFKKNSIISGARMHSISQIRLVSVLPKESERQKELQAMHSEMERDQRAADMLFENDGGKKGKGIRNYFSSSAKRSAGGGSKRRSN